jgi:hypothetical protein
MERVDITLRLNLPQDLIDRAQSAGLLTQEQIEQWLTEELDRQQKLNRFFDKIDRLAALEPRLSEAEIDSEIEAYRREKRQRHEDDSA